MRFTRQLPQRKIPILGWSLVLAFTLFVARRGFAEVVTEADVIRRVRAGDESAEYARSAALVAEARETQAGLYENPSVTWNREHLTKADPEEREDMLYLTLPVDVSGRRAVRRALARSETAGLRSSATRAQTEATVRALLTFYEALFAEQRSAVIARRVKRLEAAAQVVARRQEEGTTSGYERDRIEVELELAQSELSESELEARVLRAELKALLHLDSEPKLTGSLAARELAPGGNLNTPPARRASLRHAQAAEREARDAAKGTLPTWFPALSLSGGVKLRRAGSDDRGYMAQVALELPVFSRGQDVQDELKAEQRRSSAQRRSEQREIRIELARASEQHRLTARELARFNEATSQRLERLERAAQSSYREGHSSLYELLDAQAAQSRIEERRISLAFKAKRAEILLRAARGDFE